MPPPSQLSIMTSSLRRLIKEEASYRSELEMQQKAIERLEEQQEKEKTQLHGADGEDEEIEGGFENESGNDWFLIRQEKTALEETKTVLPRLRERIADTIASLEGLLASAEEGHGDADAARAREAIEEAKAASG